MFFEGLKTILAEAFRMSGMPVAETFVSKHPEIFVRSALQHNKR